MRIEFSINPRKTGLFLGLLAAYFAAQSLVMEFLIEKVLDNEVYHSLVMALDLFSVNAEETIPTWYSTLLLFGAAALLALVAIAKFMESDRFRWHWLGLALLFLYLSMDEGAVIHEIVADGLQNTLDLSGFLTFGWQIVAVPLVLLVGLLYLRFVLHLPRRTRNRFVLAGLIYIGGAMVVEGISANQYDIGGGVTFEYLAIATIEELCEMLGVVVFIDALLGYMAEQDYGYAFLTARAAETAVDSGLIAAPAGTNTIIPARPRPLALSPRRFAVSSALVIAGLNAALIVWAFSTQPPAPAPAADSTVQSHQAVIDQLATQGVLVTRLIGEFDGDNAAARQVTRGLLDLYDEVMVVTMESAPGSIVLAADDLPFDRGQLAEVLRANGETQFIIFDTPAVRMMAANTEK